MSVLLQKIFGKHPLLVTILVVVAFTVTMTVGVLYWGWEPSEWDLLGM